MEDIEYKHDDEWALKLIRKEINSKSGTAIQKLPKVQRDDILAVLKNKGISIRQLERLTGINRGVIQKARQSQDGVKQDRPH